MTTNVYILLDRSGSMASRWPEALGTINGYVAGLAKTEHDGVVTCVAFDHMGTGWGGPGFQAGMAMAIGDALPARGVRFQALRTMVRPKDWQQLTRGDAEPHGGTPLYDAIGRICSMADADANPRGLILIMTDGEENSSREVTKEGATALLDKQRARGWEVINLGMDFREVAVQALSFAGHFF